VVSASVSGSSDGEQDKLKRPSATAKKSSDHEDEDDVSESSSEEESSEQSESDSSDEDADEEEADDRKNPTALVNSKVMTVLCIVACLSLCDQQKLYGQ